MSILLEAPVFTVEAGLKAAEFGINRLELCSDFGEGGETPSAGALSFLKEKVQIPVFVMIRPRGGDFVYTPEELYVMRKDIAILRSQGADGFVFGVLDRDGHVDKEACKYLMHAVEDSPCTFHRAFDICKDKDKAIEDIISCGFQRILTSGGENDVTKGMSNILKWIGQVSDQIIIMPGGGLKPTHIAGISKKSMPAAKPSGQLKVIIFIHQYLSPMTQMPSNRYLQLTGHWSMNFSMHSKPIRINRPNNI